MWKTRIHHEAKMHELNCFVTLTFADQHLPPDMSVSVRDIQLFMKRLRKRSGKVRFFACGEYGDLDKRPHYHLILFGYDFPDRKPWSKTKSGHVQDRSAILESLWPFGFSTVGTVTHQSAGYVARYVLKKINGQRAEDHYQHLNPFTGEFCRVRPEFARMSTKPAIGHSWFVANQRDAFPSDFVVIDGSKKPIPSYYLKQLKKQTLQQQQSTNQYLPSTHPLNPDYIKLQRHIQSIDNKEEKTPERLAVREEVTRLRINRLKRNLTGDDQ